MRSSSDNAIAMMKQMVVQMSARQSAMPKSLAAHNHPQLALPKKDRATSSKTL